MLNVEIILGAAGLIVGATGAMLSWCALRRIKKVDSAIDGFKKDMQNKRALNRRITAFNKEKKILAEEAFKLLKQLRNVRTRDELAIRSQMNVILPIVKRMISNYGELYENAGISKDDKDAFLKYISIAEKCNNGIYDEDLEVQAIECLGRLLIIFEGEDIENEYY